MRDTSEPGLAAQGRRCSYDAATIEHKFLTAGSAERELAAVGGDVASTECSCGRSGQANAGPLGGLVVAVRKGPAATLGGGGRLVDGRCRQPGRVAMAGGANRGTGLSTCFGPG